LGTPRPASSTTRTATAVAAVSDAFGNRLAASDAALTIDDAAVLRAEPGGVLRALGAGTVTVRARAGAGVDSVRVRAFRPLRATAIGAGVRFACALAAEDGRAYCWGDEPSDPGVVTFRAVPTPVSDDLRLASLSVGLQHACGLTADGAAWCWGANLSAQLGDGSRRSSATAVRAAPGLRLSAIAVGAEHTCALDLDGRAHCWGQNATGELGDGATSSARATPVPVAVPFPFASLSAGASFSCGVTRAAPPPAPEAGTLYCWGQGGPWLGLGAAVPRFAPVPTPRAVDPARRFTRVSVGTQNACAVGADARGYCWGAFFSDVPTPVFTDRAYTDVSAGGVALACALATGGDAYCIGMNGTAQLGTAESVPQGTAPAKVIGSGYTAIAAGRDFDRNFACGIADGVARCWGSNSVGQTGQYAPGETPAGCGREPCVRRPTPVQAPER
jgi:alpha-tubulin suppressor-like RCC1 family protein